MKELRFAVAQELRASGSDSEPQIVGYACKWNNRTQISNFNEVISPKPFKSLETDDVVCLVNHDDSLILGRKGINLDLTQDETGLRFTCTMAADTSTFRDTYANLKAGLYSECSFAFTLADDDGEEWSFLPDGSALRTLKSLRLWDVSVVTSPAYSGTSAAARNVVSAAAEARSASFTLQSDLAARRARVQAVLSEKPSEYQKQLARVQAVLAEKRK